MGVNGFVIIDKPQGLTSQGVVSRVRRALGVRRVGHGGTLDPLATGVLPVFAGRATRASALLLDAGKAYTAGFVCGFETDTCDTTGNILRTTGLDASPNEVAALLPQFLGEREQTPPMYSAVKVGGRKLYELAREGREVERASRVITISAIEYLGQFNGEHRFSVDCSKGTYIRELVREIGEALGCGAAMSSLRRTRTGSFLLDEAVPLDEFCAAPSLRPVDELFCDRPSLTVSPELEARIRNGAAPRTDAQPGEYRVYSDGGEFLALCRVTAGELQTVRSFFEVD